MNNPALLRFPTGAGPSPEQLSAGALADRQLEIADLYLAAAESLDVGDRSLPRALRRIRGELAVARGELRGPTQR